MTRELPPEPHETPAVPSTTTRSTFCNRDCPDVCRIVATVDNGRVTRLQGDPSHPITQGFLCHRTTHFLERQYHPERITQPLLRQGDTFVPIAWDEALDLAARELMRIKSESGPAAIFHYRSGGSLGFLLTLTDWYFANFGPVTTKRGDICSGAGDAAQLTDFGVEEAHDRFDVLNSKHIILWGKNVHVSSPHTIPLLKKAKAVGATVVVIDPLHTRSTVLGDVVLQPRPAGDFALAMAVTHLLFAHGWVSDAARALCDHVDAHEAMARSRSVESWCAEADVTPAQALALAHTLVDGPTSIQVGWGMARRGNGGAIVRALDALCVLSGNLGVRGGGVSYYHHRRTAFDVDFVHRIAPPRTLCEPLFGQAILDAHDPPIRAVWITAGNPVAMLPGSAQNEAALRSREFVVVVDAFMTDTARCANLVLPVTTLLEADDLLGAYGHHWLGAATPVVDAPPLVKSDLQIMQGLAARTGHSDVMQGTAREWKERLVRPRLARHGITVDDLERGPVRNPLAPTDVIFGDGKVQTETGRVNLIHSAPTPVVVDDVDYPLWLFSCSTEQSQSSQWTRDSDEPLTCTVHPDNAPDLDGALVQLVSRAGALVVRVKHDARQRRDVVLVPKGGHVRGGRSANTLIRPAVTDMGEGGALYDERVRLMPLTTS
jgi:anaerobic selenocysteine-containing dehydrogenase